MAKQRLFVASAMANKPSPGALTTRHGPMIVLALSKEEALGLCIQEATDQMPNSDGFHDHNVVVDDLGAMLERLGYEVKSKR